MVLSSLFAMCVATYDECKNQACMNTERSLLMSATLFVVLFGFWLLLSGYFTPFLLASGAGCALAVVMFSRRMGIIDRDAYQHRLSVRAVLFYWPWLAKEIIKSGWDVSLRIVHPNYPISPALARFKPSQRSDLGLVIHANSITLTPGTISVEVSANEFLVHALTEQGAAALADSDMDRRVSKLEGKA
jgi:multicomponent Na+:H+ antiporter subunit E